jgi:hypothetical protein
VMVSSERFRISRHSFVSLSSSGVRPRCWRGTVGHRPQKPAVAPGSEVAAARLIGPAVCVGVALNDRLQTQGLPSARHRTSAARATGANRPVRAGRPPPAVRHSLGGEIAERPFQVPSILQLTAAAPWSLIVRSTSSRKLPIADTRNGRTPRAPRPHPDMPARKRPPIRCRSCSGCTRQPLIYLPISCNAQIPQRCRPRSRVVTTREHECNSDLDEDGKLVVSQRAGICTAPA